VPAADAPAARLAVAFSRVLRQCGLAVPLGNVLTFVDALGALGMDQREAVYWAGRTTLVHRPEDHGTYDRAFAAFWDGRHALVDAPPAEIVHMTLAIDDESNDDAADDEPIERDDEPTITLRFSPREVLRHKDFATCTATELDEARRLMADLRLAGEMRRSRRMVRSHRPRGRHDLRRTVREALRAGGEPVRRRHLRAGQRPRRLVLLVDISGSMEPYARALVRFAHSAVIGRRKVEVFTLGTRLTRLTRELSYRDADVALARAGQRAADWSGGTRLGDGLRAFNDEWGQRGMARGAVVVICSDGWDRGDPEVLAEQMRRLSRVARRIVWVNPLKVTPGYAPLARGMAAALPYVDAFVEGHSLAAIEELARVIDAPSTPRRKGAS
jgi:uncharacterized protein with von Willebrand factor type A (vWA) domain